MQRSSAKKFKFTGTNIARNRAKMIKAAKEGRAAHTLFWDSDSAGFSIMVTQNGTLTFRSNFQIRRMPRDRKLWRVGDAIWDAEARELLAAQPNGENILAHYLRKDEAGRLAMRIDLEIERARLLIAEDRKLAARAIDPRTLDEAGRAIALETGKHPAVIKAEEEASGEGKTLKEVADAYFADTRKGGGANLRSRSELERKLNVDLKPWHDRAISSITKADIRELLRCKHAKSPISANRLLSFIKRLWAWAASEDLIDADPASAIKPLADEVARARFLSEDEINLFWKACGNLPEPAGRIFQLLLLTGQRRGEVGGMRWSEISKINYRDKNNKPVSAPAWSLPAERTKRREANLIPLTPLALKLIGERAANETREHIFAASNEGKNAKLKIPGADKTPDGYRKWKIQLDEEIGKLVAKETKEPYNAQKHNIAAWRLHDLRATFTSHLEAANVDRRVLSRILNHAEGDKSITARYARYSFDREAADALKLWSAELERICGLNVHKLRKAQLGI